MNSETFTSRFGGKGEVKATRILEVDQLQGKGRLFARNLLTPGSSIGWHKHQGDFETYYILSGEGTVDDNGKKAIVKAGDVIFTAEGESHSIENTGDTDLVFLAVILYV